MRGRFSIFATVFVDFHYSIFPFLSRSRRLSLFQLPSGIWHLPSAICYSADSFGKSGAQFHRSQRPIRCADYEMNWVCHAVLAPWLPGSLAPWLPGYCISHMTLTISQMHCHLQHGTALTLTNCSCDLHLRLKRRFLFLSRGPEAQPFAARIRHLHRPNAGPPVRPVGGPSVSCFTDSSPLPLATLLQRPHRHFPDTRGRHGRL